MQSTLNNILNRTQGYDPIYVSKGNDNEMCQISMSTILDIMGEKVLCTEQHRRINVQNL